MSLHSTIDYVNPIPVMLRGLTEKIKITNSFQTPKLSQKHGLEILSVCVKSFFEAYINTNETTDHFCNVQSERSVGSFGLYNFLYLNLMVRAFECSLTAAWGAQCARTFYITQKHC